MKMVLRALVFVLGLTFVGPADATIFSFRQDGFSEGAFVAGTFEGADLDMDGEISSFDGEVTAFAASFSGNSVVAAFAMDFANLIGLVYELDGDIGDGVADDEEGIWWDNGATHEYLAGPGPLNLCDGSADCGEVGSLVGFDVTLALVLVEVPEPATALLLTSGLAALAAGLRRR